MSRSRSNVTCTGVSAAKRSVTSEERSPTTMASRSACSAMSAGVIMCRVVVIVSVNGRPSSTSCIAVRAKDSCTFSRYASLVAWLPR